MGEGMTARTGNDAKMIWDRVFQSVFSDAMSMKIAAEKAIYLKQGDHTYIDLRNEAAGITLGTINYLIAYPSLTWENWRDHVRSLPLIQQGFLLDRFRYVDEYLSKVRTREFLYEDKIEDFLRWGLIDMWNARPRENEWR